MSEPGQSNGATPTSSTAGGSSFGATLLHVAWLAILLGIVMEVLLLLLAGGFGILPGFESTVADLVGKVSWSTIVCAGLALGPAASKVREPVMGLLGLLAAPLAFNVSRFLQQGAVQILAVGGIAGSSTPVYLLALIKGVEYGVPRRSPRLGCAAPLGRSGGPRGGGAHSGDPLRQRGHGPYLLDFS